MAARQNAQLLDRAMLSQEERVKVLALASLLPTSLPLTYDTAHLDPTALSTDRGNTRIAILTLSTFLLFYRSQEHLHAAQQAGEEEIDTTYTHGLVRIADDFRWYPEVANRNFDFGRPLHHYYLVPPTPYPSTEIIYANIISDSLPSGVWLGLMIHKAEFDFASDFHDH